MKQGKLSSAQNKPDRWKLTTIRLSKSLLTTARSVGQVAIFEHLFTLNIRFEDAVVSWYG